MGAIALLIVSLFGQAPVRTADITLRGLTSADFPRVTKLADNVYAYEQIDPTKRTVTVNNLIVITTAGVLIAESQGTVENVRRLIADVARRPHRRHRRLPRRRGVPRASVLRAARQAAD